MCTFQKDLKKTSGTHTNSAVHTYSYIQLIQQPFSYYIHHLLKKIYIFVVGYMLVYCIVHLTFFYISMKLLIQVLINNNNNKFDCLIQNYEEIVFPTLLILTSVSRNLVFNGNGIIFSSFLFSLAFFRVRCFCIPHNSAKKQNLPYISFGFHFEFIK